MKNLFYLLLFIPSLGIAQTKPLQEYIAFGLENNLVLQQNTLSLQKAEYALKVAKGMFLPEANMQTRYSLANGGRTIDFPVGDLLNPVYSTLNQMMEQQGQPGSFPQIENEEIAFMRAQEYDAKISVIQPIYARSLGLNKQIAEEQLSMSQLELEKFKRELRFQIKEAYYNYLQTVQMVALVERTQAVVVENLRVSQKLFESDLITKDAVLRAKSDVSRVKLFETTVLKNKAVAQNYFNFLINRSLEDSIRIELIKTSNNPENVQTLTNSALNKREELSQLDAQSKIYAHLAAMSRAENIPSLALAIDAGIQGAELSNISNNDYVMGSVVLNWKIFNGNIHKNKRQQALIEVQKSNAQKQEAMQQIRLEIKRDYLEVKELNQNLEMANTRNIEAKEVYRILEKRFRQGEAAMVELLDARNNMVEAESDVITTQYKLQISLARLEKSSMISKQ